MHGKPGFPEDVGITEELRPVPVNGHDDGAATEKAPVGEAKITDGALGTHTECQDGDGDAAGVAYVSHPSTCQQHQVGIAEGVAAVLAQEEGAAGGEKPPRRSPKIAGDAQGLQCRAAGRWASAHTKTGSVGLQNGSGWPQNQLG